MPSQKNQTTVTFGGWYQRTTLHLSEIYDLFARGKSHLNLSLVKLENYFNQFDFISVTREPGDFEYVKAVTKSGIEVHYYEDGLYVLSLNSSDVLQAEAKLRHYFDTTLHPAISYIFSLGAPTPKVLAAIKTPHQTVISINSGQSPLSKQDLAGLKIGEVYSQITTNKLTVHKTPSYIIIVSPPKFTHTREMVEMQIFFREFKDQLQRYLDLHRQIWEEISVIKERGSISGTEIEPLRQQLDSYEKTINLIKSRIAQMSSYVRTRSSIAKKLELDDALLSLFQYKYETLIDTHAYIQEIWKMTSDYVTTAIQVLNEAKAQSTANGINSLRMITTVGVLAGIFGYLTKDQLPKFTLVGFWYFFVLVIGTWLIDKLVARFYQQQKYKLKFTEKIGIN
ncbi:hypothetical protein KBC75_02575 [Candidatus Shapirobacteria bacterium]|nr:hypothetical protein [Candidatus Shapirobacteria bacterium]